MRLKVTVPATSANLGPGFDSLGMALAHYDVYEVEVVSSGLEIQISGEGANSAAKDETNLIYRSMMLVFDSVGKKLPGIRLTCHNSIPHGRGMGSSGAAVAGGVMLAAGLLDNKFSEKQLLEFATKMEGHPDNVAPAIWWIDNCLGR
jgi:homoserine kinase